MREALRITSLRDLRKEQPIAHTLRMMGTGGVQRKAEGNLSEEARKLPTETRATQKRFVIIESTLNQDFPKYGYRLGSKGPGVT